MALFKIFKGSNTAKITDSSAAGYISPTVNTDGYAYYDTSTKLFYIDAEYPGISGISRQPINAAHASSASFSALTHTAMYETTPNENDTGIRLIYDTYVKRAGDTMTGALEFPSQSSVYNDKNILFSGGARIGSNTGGDIGIYARDIYLRTGSHTTNNGYGLYLCSTAVRAHTANGISLGIEATPWKNVYSKGFMANNLTDELAGSGFILKTSNVTQGYFQNTTIGTSSSQGYTMLTIGNSKASTEELNSQGALAIYGKDSAKHTIYSSLTGSTNRNIYLQNYAGNQYLIHAENANAIGDANIPVYVAANGRITAGTSITGNYVHKAGDTMSGNLIISRSAPEVKVIDTSSSAVASLLVGSGHINHGLYSYGYSPTTTSFTDDAKWMVYRDKNGDVHLNGIADRATNDAAGNSIIATYVHKAGDTMTGNLIMSGTNTTPAHIVLSTTAYSWIKYGAGDKDFVIGDNGTNIWINGRSTEIGQSDHKVFIGTGYNSTAAAGYNSIYVAIPNDTNTGASSYSVLHTGENTSTVKTTLSGSLEVPTLYLSGGTSSKYITPASNSNDGEDISVCVDGACPLVIAKEVVRRGASYSNTTLGSSTYPWAAAYATTFIGALSGTASNAIEAYKFSSTRKIELTGDVTGSDTKDGSGGWSIAATLKAVNSNTGSWGPGSDTTIPDGGGSFSVPYITVNGKGLTTAAANKTITIPSVDRVKISNSTVNGWRKILLHPVYNSNSTPDVAVSNTSTYILESQHIEANPYSGQIRAYSLATTSSVSSRLFWSNNTSSSPSGAGYFAVTNGITQAYIQNSTLGTAASPGYATVSIGNSVPTGTANNSRGQILIYNNTGRHCIYSDVPDSASYGVHLSGYSGTQYLTHVGSTSAVGDANTPVYVGNNGRIITTGKSFANYLTINSASSTYVHKAGDTMTGNLHMTGANLYVDTGYAAIGQNTIYSVLNGQSTTSSFRLNVAGDAYIKSNVYSHGLRVYISTTGTTYGTIWYNHSTSYGYTRLYCGSATTVGYCQLVLGNNRPSATADNVVGQICLYSSNTGYTSLTGAYGALGGTNRNYISTGYFSGTQLWGAVYNDYAEFRETKNKIEPGCCVVEQGDGSLELSTKRLMRGGEIVSDTYGFAIGETEKAKTPIAASGRVLAYCYEGQEYAKNYIGWPVGTGPEGTVSIMTEEEEKLYPSRIIGTISEIPNYDEWQCGSKDEPEYIKVNGRIWIRIR